MAEEKKETSWLWPKIIDEVSAFDAAKAGAVGGVFFMFGLVAGVALVYFTNAPSLLNQPDLQSFYISQGVQFLLASFLTWRVYTGNGRIASILLLLWLLTEVAFKLLAGQLSLGWAVAWGAAIIALFNGVRGSWALHRFRKTGATAS